MTGKKRNPNHDFKQDSLGVFQRSDDAFRAVRGLHAKGYGAEAIARMTGLAEAGVREAVRRLEAEAERKR